MERFNSNHSDKKYLQDRYKWIQFFIERFDPLSHLIMISLFIAGHMSLVDKGVSSDALLLFIGTTVFFFKLRCFDEVKDLDLDMKINPSRPLPRELLSVFDMKDAIILCFIFENIIFYTIDLDAGIAMSIASLYSLIMYKEFFLGSWFRDKLTSYASAHTLVTILLSLSIFCAIDGRALYALDISMYFFSVVSWLLFNIFELGRKTFLESEERDQVESYSKVWGKGGAVVLVLVHACIAEVILALGVGLSSSFAKIYFNSCFVVFVLSGIYFLIKKSGRSGSFFRGYSSFYIILIYLGVIIEKLL
ncbi:hypothetical protein [Halobacteriovorax sp.]|uniref:hypothetical protein n=1 Tax=Halobacteriovorax sp. TaxID=2020862 RepID=UPI0035664AFC